MILAGDIGGTNTRLALFETRRGRLLMRDRAETKNQGRKNLQDIVDEFLVSRPRPLTRRPRIACFGVAGPVKQGRAELTNLDWHLDEAKLRRSLQLPAVKLINDLVAHAQGIDLLPSKDVLALHTGRAARDGNRAILAPGTGLGEAGLVFDERTHGHRPVPSEGGHCDFAPTNDQEAALWRFLRERNQRCSWEDVLSGPGLRNIWDFLTSRGPQRIDSALGTEDPSPAEITRAANAGTCPACVAAVELFARLCGAEAGNLALKFLATGGVYFGGGIPRRIVKFLRRPAVRRAFAQKGPREVRELLQAVPIRLILSEDNALWGAARSAQTL